MEQAIYISTLGGAEVLGVEDEFGSISAGKHADFIVLDRNLFYIQTTEIYGTNVEKTILGGRLVYSYANQGDPEVEGLNIATPELRH